MAIAGRVAIVPKGNWSADATYKRLDAVTYNNTLYFAKRKFRQERQRAIQNIGLSLLWAVSVQSQQQRKPEL